MLAALACPLLEEPVVVVFLVDFVVVMALFEDVTLSFLVFEEELEPLGVFRITIVDFVPIPVVM